VLAAEVSQKLLSESILSPCVHARQLVASVYCFHTTDSDWVIQNRSSRHKDHKDKSTRFQPRRVLSRQETSITLPRERGHHWHGTCRLAPKRSGNAFNDGKPACNRGVEKSGSEVWELSLRASDGAHLQASSQGRVRRRKQRVESSLKHRERSGGRYGPPSHGTSHPGYGRRRTQKGDDRPAGDDRIGRRGLRYFGILVQEGEESGRTDTALDDPKVRILQRVRRSCRVVEVPGVASPCDGFLLLSSPYLPRSRKTCHAILMLVP